MEQQSNDSTRRSHLPRPLTRFLGRETELAEIIQLLANPSCTLLTLVGPGGIGKTRLALQAAARLLDLPDHPFTGGVYIVLLQPVASADLLVSAILDALNLPSRGQPDPRAQLLNFLQDKTLLLVLDNFEHLLADNGEILLVDILAAAPGVKLLVTSREVLSLKEEWLYPVAGMSYPPPQATPSAGESDSPEIVESYSAVQLFVERARQVRRDFSPAEELAGIIRICQLVEGMPLALELAAVWTKTLPCQVIAAEIQHNLDFLTTNLRNVPERQRSMRAVFNYCWQRLTAQEQLIFKRLSVFRGGFQRHAAERVAGASLATLSSLVDKSLLRWDPSGRYHIHELLYQYAAEQLVLSPEEVNWIYDRRCAYYTQFLAERLAALNGGRQLEAAAEIELELENIRSTWRWAAAQVKVEEIYQAAHALMLFYQIKTRYWEGFTTFGEAIHSLRASPPTPQVEKTLALLLVDWGWFCIRLGQFAEAKAGLEQSRAIYDRLNLPRPPGHSTDPLSALGILATIMGDYAGAINYGQAARRVAETQHHPDNLAAALYLLAGAYLAQGDYPLARQYAQQACAILQERQNNWLMAYCLLQLGEVALALGDYAEAQHHYRRSHAIRTEFNDLEGMAVALNHLGQVAIRQEDYAQAQQLYRQSRAIYQEINDRGGLATALNGLGLVAGALGDTQAARQQFSQALQIASEIHFIPLALSILTEIGALLLPTGSPERGAALLAFVQHHPASDHQTKTRARQLLLGSKFASLPAVDSGAGDDLQTIIELAQAALVAPVQAEPHGHKGAAENITSSLLVEPLTPRELEILRLLAGGLSNPEIAAALIITVGTVKAHTHRIYGKLNAANRVQAIARAQELGLL